MLLYNEMLWGTYNGNKTVLFQLYFRCSYTWNETRIKHLNNSKTF